MMDETKHTPGPWKVITEATAREVEVFEIADISHFRVICDGRGDGYAAAGDAHADARLIAAAPALLTALEAACNVLFLLKDEVSALGHSAEQVPINARAAIAKATEAA